MSFSPSVEDSTTPTITGRPTTSSPKKAKSETALRQPRETFRTQRDLEQYLQENPGVLPHPEDIRHLVDEEFPDVVSSPTMEDVDRSLLGPKKQTSNHPYHIGDWIERLGDDMNWHFEPIRRLVRFDKEPDVVYYKTEAKILVLSSKVRCSEEAIKRHFGMRPHLWQQYAMIHTEQSLRFQPHHQNDFELITFEEEALILWNSWLNNPKNTDFLALFSSHPEHVQEKVVHHMLSPFRLMDEVVHEWDMSEADASVYQYSSFLGSGFLTSVTMVGIQLIVPFLLLLFQTRTSPRFPGFTITPNASSVDFQVIFDQTWEGFCYQPVAVDGLIMQYIVFLVYTIRVVPAVAYSFYSTVGDAPTMQSRLNSIRIQTWNQGDDTVFMKCGYKMDRYMNAFYIALINLVMLLCLFLADNTVSIILNALAIEFVYNFDREVASMFWYDQGLRFLRVGVLEILLNGTLLMEHFYSVKLFCEYYDASMEEYTSKISGPLYDPSQARKDATSPLYKSAKDRLWFASARCARKLGRKEALWLFEEQRVNFGFFDRFLVWLMPDKIEGYFLTGILNRYADFCTWSKWEEALFLPRVPVPGNLAASGKSWSNSGGLISNFNEDSMLPPVSRFLAQCADTLRFYDVVHIIQVVYRRGQYYQLPFLLVDGLFDWFTFWFILVIFPLGLLLYAYLVIGCQVVMTNTATSWLYHPDYAWGG